MDDDTLYAVLPSDWQAGKDTLHVVSTPKQRVAYGKVLLGFRAEKLERTSGAA